MVTRGSGATKAKYFEFGGSATNGSVAEYGACMPQKTLDTIMRNGCFDASFKDNLRKVWRPMPEIKKSLEARRDALKLLTESVQAAYAATRARSAQPGAASAGTHALATASPQPAAQQLLMPPPPAPQP